MKKVLFTTLSIIAVAAMMMVSCKKEPVEKPDDNKEEQKPEDEPKVDEDLVGTWTITGEAYGWDQTKGVAMTDNDNVWTAAEVSIKGEGIKFVKDASWDVNLGATEGGAKEDDVEFDLKKGGENIKGAKDGVYSVTLNLLTKKAKIKFVKDLEPEGPDDAETFDYTPSAEYLAETNLWKAADADPDKTIVWFYNPNWAGEKAAPKTLFYKSTYYVELPDADAAAEWTTQMKIKPANFVLDPAKYYRFTCKVTSSTGTNVFFKMYHDGVDWPESFETPPVPNRIHVEAGETKEIVKTFQPLDNNQILLIDFANHAADNVIHVKDIIIEETTGLVAVDGDFADWTYINPFDGTGDRITEWKAESDANNIYLFYSCPASVVKSRGIWSNYLTLGIDTDNDEETTFATDYGLGAGLEVTAVAFPFSNEAGADVTFYTPDKAKSESFIQFKGEKLADVHIACGGALVGENAYVEYAIPRNLIGSPASGTEIALKVGMSSQSTAKQTITLK